MCWENRSCACESNSMGTCYRSRACASVRPQYKEMVLYHYSDLSAIFTVRHCSCASVRPQHKEMVLYHYSDLSAIFTVRRCSCASVRPQHKEMVLYHYSDLSAIFTVRRCSCASVRPQHKAIHGQKKADVITSAFLHQKVFKLIDVNQLHHEQGQQPC